MEEEVNIQGKVSSFLMELFVGPMKTCVESRKLILKECKIQISIYVWMCLCLWCVHVHSLFSCLSIS